MESNDTKSEFKLPPYFDSTCDIEKCSASFVTYEEAREHYLHVHSIEHGYVRCCSGKFKWLPDIQSHILWHDNPDAFK